MASQKHLKDLLQEDQEPFHLKNYISDRCGQIKRPKTHLQVKKRRPISQNAGFPSRFCRKACFFSFHESPDARKSPFFDFRSPNRSPNAFFLNIPARTAALLVEAAVRIQKQSSEQSSITRTRSAAGNALGLFGSVLKKLMQRKKREIGGCDSSSGGISVKDILRWESPIVRKVVSGNAKRGGVADAVENAEYEKTTFETTRSSGRSSSSAVWSESNEEEKSFYCDFETSSSSRGSESDGLEKMDEIIMDGGDFMDDDKQFCESPFHFVLQTSPNRCGFKTPNLSSPSVTPSRRVGQEMEESYEVESLTKVQMEEEEEEEEEKEQSSPVSVLDPPFQDDDEDNHMHSNLLSTFTSVQRAKHELLQKLRRFEQLAGLDPVELEKRMFDQETEEEEEICEVMTQEETKIHHHNQYRHIHELAQRILETNFDDDNELKRVHGGMQLLITDLMAEEIQDNGLLMMDGEFTAKRVCERLESWRDVEANTIDMMVELDFREEGPGLWKKNNREVQETGLEIEFAIFGCLVEEISSELVLGQ